MSDTNALENWNTHMRLRLRQQDRLSVFACRPPESLLMNQANRFRETQENREMLYQVLPLVQSGYGHYLGSEFWRLPPRFGDEMSGIATTLNKTERGIREPITKVGLPCSIRRESGLTVDTVCHPCRAWHQSIYWKQQCQKLGEVGKEVDFKRLDIDELVVIGSSKPFFPSICNSRLMEDKNKEEEHRDLQEEMVLQSNNVEPKPKALTVPALRVSGQLAKWNGISDNYQDQVGINTTILFEGLTGELQLSHLDLHNEGPTAIFYSWQQLPLPHQFPHLPPRTKKPHFYFKSSSSVILPGDAQKIHFIFKSHSAGFQTELWQLNTHPVLLQGAPIQVMLRGVAQFYDKNVAHRLYTQNKLKKIATWKMCQTILYDLLRWIHTPDSSTEVQQSEEEKFICKNPKLFYKNQPVDALKKLWHKVKPESDWDLSVATLRQALLSLPNTETADDCLNQDTGLAQLNTVLLELYEPSPKMLNATATTLGQLLWRQPLDTLTSEAMRLKHQFQLLEKDTWLDPEDISLDIEINANEKKDRKGGVSIKEKKNPTKTKKDEDKRKRRGTPTDPRKTKKEKNSKDADPPQETAPKDPFSGANMMNIYTKVLHQQVYGLIENLLKSLCDLTDESSLPTDHKL
ncbi:MYCBP-associated protein-like [Eucyclogobius newberryi]|uniref:MYCBP-associated protein-like n=1 Tax=Eucyclogobius newberryi TaxID=166745 RepID=UPI003B5A6320